MPMGMAPACPHARMPACPHARMPMPTPTPTPMPGAERGGSSHIRVGISSMKIYRVLIDKSARFPPPFTRASHALDHVTQNQD